MVIKNTEVAAVDSYEYAPSAETKAAIVRVNLAIDRSKRLEVAVAAVPNEIRLIEAAFARKRTELSDAQAEAAIEKNSKNEALRLQDFDKRRGELASLQQDLELACGKLVSLELRAVAIDAEVVDAGTELNREAGIDGGRFRAQISDEVIAAMPQLKAVIEKTRALANAGHRAFFSDFLDSAQVFEPTTVMVLTSGIRGINLLDADANNPTPHPVSEHLEPVRAAQTAFRMHRPYVQLAKRPTPYVMAGYEIRGRDTGNEPPRVQMKSLQETASEPYVIRSGNRTQSAPTNVNIGSQLVEKSMKDS
jgi:hypothetical protein